MEYQNTTVQTGSSTCQSGSTQPARRSAASITSDPAVFTRAVAHFKSQSPHVQVFDVNNSLWDVHDARATKHGFDLLFGRPANPHAPGNGKCRLIATPALAAYWEAHRTHPDGAIYDLPVSRSTIRRIRNLLGFNLVKDRRALWRKRTADLQSLSSREFAARYKVTQGNASFWRSTFLGRQVRLPGWWKDPAVLAVLCRPGITSAEIGATFCLSATQARCLRRRALRLDHPASQQPAQDRHKIKGRWATIEQLRDHHNRLWDVSERRPTKYGFDIFFGYPADCGLDPYATAGTPRLIATTPLVQHLQANRQNTAVANDLPAGSRTLSDLRRRIGLVNHAA